MSYCFTSSLQFTAVVPFFVFQWQCFHDHCAWRGFTQWCLAAPFELPVDWNSVLFSSAVKQLCTFSGRLHFWWKLLGNLCVRVEAEAWYFKGLQTRVWQQACRWLHRQAPGRKPTLLARIRLLLLPPASLENTVIDIAEGHTAAQLKGKCGRACI